MITNYIPDAASVRALLGLDSSELPDTQIELPIFELALKAELRTLSSTEDVLQLFEEVQSKPEADRTYKERTLFESVQVFSAYAVASMLLTALTQIINKTETDSKASFTRPDINLEMVRDSLVQGKTIATSRLATVVQDVVAEQAGEDRPVPNSFLGFRVATLMPDPVVGDEAL